MVFLRYFADLSYAEIAEDWAKRHVVIDFRSPLQASGSRLVHGNQARMLAVMRSPRDSSWHELCESVGVRRIWPEVTVARLAS